MPAIDPLAVAAVEPVHSDMIVGLGTGRAASRGIQALARRVEEESLRIRCVATSVASARLAESLGLQVVELHALSAIDYLFDGADEVDAQLNMLKGGGGAMTREKIVARAARKRVYLIQQNKLVVRLGTRMPLPIEVLPLATACIQQALAANGMQAVARTDDESIVLTDGGNVILDVPIPHAADLPALDRFLNDLPGVVGHGLFLHEADQVIIENENGNLDRLTRPR